MLSAVLTADRPPPATDRHERTGASYRVSNLRLGRTRLSTVVNVPDPALGALTVSHPSVRNVSRDLRVADVWLLFRAEPRAAIRPRFRPHQLGVRAQARSRSGVIEHLRPTRSAIRGTGSLDALPRPLSP